MLVSEALGATAIYAGVALWRGTPLGFALSRVIQGMQIVRVYTGLLLFVVAIGPQVLVNFFFGPNFSITTSTSVPLPVSHVVEFAAAFDVLGGGQWAEVAPTGFGINLLAVFAFVVLLRSGPVRRKIRSRNLPRRDNQC